MKSSMMLYACCAVLLALSACGKKAPENAAQQMPPKTELAQPPQTPQGAQPAQVRKYDVKSGIVTYEDVIEAGTMTIKSKRVTYFDDYGMRECEDRYTGDNLRESYFSDGKNLYSVMYSQKTTYLRGPAYRGTMYRFAWDEVSSQDKSSGKAKQIAAMPLAGKTCDAFQVGDPASGDYTTYAGWNHVAFMIDVHGKGTHSVQKAVKFEENAAVPPEKFQPPAGFPVKNSPM